MKVRLLPSTFEEDGSASPRQHLSCLVINGSVAIDAGSLAMAANEDLRRSLRDVVLTHAHLDHIAGLPLFIDDLFAGLDRPVTVYAIQEVIDVLERDIFNWSVFPRFSELRTNETPALRYHPIRIGREFRINDLSFVAFGTDHKVPSTGFVVSDAGSAIAITGDTASLDALSATVRGPDLRAILIECAFPNELSAIAETSHHLTPAALGRQLSQLRPACPVFVINIKPNYRSEVVRQLAELKIDSLEIMIVGRDYFW
jgi:cAMP phosphodiesterase